MIRVLLVEDDNSFGYILSEYLQMHNLKVHWAKSAEEGNKIIDSISVDIALLDIMLPGMSGFEFARILRDNEPDLPFIFLSAKSMKIDKLKGYKLGAVDYITKPIDEELLVAKINSLIRSNNRNPISKVEEIYTIGAYTFKPKEQILVYDEDVTHLTARESELLRLLVQNKNQLLERKNTLKQIWGSSDEFSRKSMDVFISHLRKYLSKDSSIAIRNVHGKGFILKC